MVLFWFALGLGFLFVDTCVGSCLSADSWLLAAICVFVCMGLICRFA